jgi:hypothetical protein
MGNLTGQPWYVDLAVILLPVVAFVTLYYLIRGRYCRECGHKATKLYMHRYYCEKCFRLKFEMPLVLGAKAASVPAPVPMVATRPKTAGKNGKRRTRKKAG